MTIVSDVEIRLRADIARLQQDMTQARRSVDTALNGMSASAQALKGMIAGLAAGFSVGAFVSFIKNSIDATDALNDMSVRTKVAIEDLAGLAYAAKLGDTSLEGVASSISKLGQNIGKEGEKFRQLGITATDPLEAFKQLADIFKDIQDPQQRAAFGAEALGKSWQEAAVLLDGGSAGISRLIDRGKELSGVTEQVAADAGKFNDKIDEMGFLAQGVGTRIAADLLPMLNLLVENLSATGKEVDSTVDKFNPFTETLRALVILAGNVAFVLKTVGTEIGVWAAQIGQYYSAVFQFLQLDFKGGAATLRSAFGKGGIGDMATEDAEKSRAAFDEWEKRWVTVGTAVDTAREKFAEPFPDPFGIDAKIAQEDAQRVIDNAKRVAAFLKSGEIAAARDKAAADAAAAAKKEEAAYAGVIASIKEKMAADQMEIDGAAAITPVQQARIKLDEELRAKKIVLTAAHIKETHALLDAAEAREKNAETTKQVRAAVATLADERAASYAALVAEAAASEDLVATYGKTKLQIAQMTLARDEDRLSQRASLELMPDTVAQLEREIDARKRNIAAMGNLEVLEAQTKASEEAAAAQVSFWKSIDDTAHDTFVSILDGSKNTAQRLKDTFKSVFFDWLYQMTIKKWIINVGATLSGTGAAGAASAAGETAGSAVGTASGLSGLLGVGGIGGSMAAGAGWLTGATSLSGALGAGTSLLGTGTLAGGIAGAGVLAGAIAPIVVGLFGASKLWSAAFGMGAKEIKNTSLVGTLTPDSATGGTQSQWTQKGGWFRSDKSGTDTAAFTAEQTSAFSTAYKAILDVSKVLGDTIGADTAALSTRVQQLNIDLTGLTSETDQLAAVTKFFAGVGDSVATELVPNLAQFQQTGEALSATLQRVATNYANLDVILGTIDKTFGAVGVSSIAARERLIAEAGGIDALASGVSYFQQNFYTDAQKLEKTQTEVSASLAAMGFAGITTTEQFKAATLGIDLTTEAGADMFVKMLALAPAFKTVADAADAAAKAADAAAKAAAQTAAQEHKDQLDSLVSAISAAYSDLTKVIDAQKSAAKTALDAVIAGIDASITSVASKISKLTALSNALAAPITAVRSEQQGGASQGAARAQIQAALAIAKASGVLPSADSLKDALSALGQNTADRYGSMTDYLREQAAAGRDIKALGAITDDQLSIDEQTLRALNDQKTAAQLASEMHLAKLDAILEEQRKAVALATGSAASLNSLPAALAELAAAIGALKSAAATNPLAAEIGDIGAIQNLYSTLLGRNADAAGMQFYLDEIKKGTSWDAIKNGFLNSPEYLQGQNSSRATVDELRVLNSRMASIEENTMRTANSSSTTASSTNKFANQFDQVSAGGSVLLTGVVSV